MPYIPGEKTKAEDRTILDRAVEAVALRTADLMQMLDDCCVVRVYEGVFKNIANQLAFCVQNGKASLHSYEEARLADAIFEQGAKHGYNGAYLGELNYAITRLIQRVPQIKVERGHWKEEFRYWYFPMVVEALMLAADHTKGLRLGIGGVFKGVGDEFMARVVRAYEAVQIVKNGDCFDTPYYTKLVRVVDEHGSFVGYVEVSVQRSDKTLGHDTLDGKIMLVGKFLTKD